VVHDLPGVRGIQLLECFLGPFPGLQCQIRVIALADGPTKCYLAGMTDNGHQDGFPMSICVQKLGEIGVEHLKQADFLHCSGL